MLVVGVSVGQHVHGTNTAYEEGAVGLYTRVTIRNGRIHYDETKKGAVGYAVVWKKDLEAKCAVLEDSNTKYSSYQIHPSNPPAVNGTAV